MMDYKVVHGDCIEEMAKLPDNSMDAIVTDPPYHLYSIVQRFGKEGSAPAQYGKDGVFQRATKGFMGKEWDGGDISYRPDTWAACLRVLKPGGHMLAFGGSRTFHRIAVAIEDAGFELRDTVMWVYGCLSEDTEILTLDGWVRYDSPLTASPVVCYNSQKNTFEAHLARRKYLYDNKHTAYHIKSDFTDQIVSRNHRVLIERNGEWVFDYAENLQEMENIPFLESLHNLPETIYDFYSGTSVQKQDLLGTVQRQADFLAKEGQRETCGAKGLYPDNLCSVRETGVEAQFRPSAGSFANMQLSLQRNIEGTRVGETCKQGESCLEQRVRTEIERENDRSFKSSMEGRSNIFQAARELCWSKICKMPSRIFANGKKRWLHNGTSVNGGKANGEVTVERGSRASCQPSTIGQQIGEPNALFEQPASQNVRGEGQPSTTLATITPVEYKGKVWCVEVPTGAFVARRNGQIFITGNSGFPKSHDVSKAIDKEAGAERTSSYIRPDFAARSNKLPQRESQVICGDKGVYTLPATPAALQWQGWGTALKPAFEPIILARKPLDGTVAGNVLKWGVGGINIDGCRVEMNGDKKQLGGCGNYGKNPTGMFLGGRSTDNDADALKERLNSTGRWPANFIHDGSEEVLELMPETKSGARKAGFTNKDTGYDASSYEMRVQWDEDVPADSGSAARFFYCAKASKQDRDEGCEGLDERPAFDNPNGNMGANMGSRSGPRRNNHPTVKPTSLMRYLCRLITPPNGLILDPFMRSGSTGKAAILEGFNFIGIEREAEYVEIATSRLEWAKTHMPACGMADCTDITNDQTLF